MRKSFLFGVLLAFLLLLESACAMASDGLDWVLSDYVGVGAIDMQKITDRKIYTDLMALFVTDPDARQVLGELEKAGLNSKSIRRIVVGIPQNVDKGEFVVFWEIQDAVDKYLPVLGSRESELTKYHYEDKDYYCMKQNRICLMVNDTRLVLGSEDKIRGVIDVVIGKSSVKKNDALIQKAQQADQTKDAWLAFSLNDASRARIGAADPIVDMSVEGKGQIRLGAVQSGVVSLDFSTGLKSEILVLMKNEDDAKAYSEIIGDLMKLGLESEDVKFLGLTAVIEGIRIHHQEKNVAVTIDYSSDTFMKLQLMVTDLVKAAAHEESAKAKASKPAIE